MGERKVNDLLEEFHEDTLRKFMPVILIMGLVCFFGIVGNAFTIYFYGFVTRKTPTVFLITALATVDLIVTVLIIPNIVEMVLNVKYTNSASCKITHFFGHWTVGTSPLFLWFISIDRYRHVCCHSKKQVNFMIARRVMISITVFAFFLSIRDFINFDTIDFPINDRGKNDSHAIGHICTTRDDPEYKISLIVFHGIDALLAVAILVTLFYTYGNIIWTLKKSGFALSESLNQTSHQEQSSTDDTTGDTSEDQTSESQTGEEQTRHMEQAENPQSRQDQLTNTVNNNHGGNPIISNIRNIEKSLTLMMCVVSIVFVVCFVPYLIIKLGIRWYRSASELELGVGIQLAIRFTYVNSFANPIIYCIFNPKFRRFILETILPIKRPNAC